MRITGIVAEYNPLHRGHAHHLAEARRRTDAEAIVVVLAGNFTQRGTPALLDAADRCRMALEAGADLVLLLPCLWAVRDAEHYALGAVELLRLAGCGTVCCGAEDADGEALRAIAAFLEAEPEDFRKALARRLDAGDSLAAARSALLAERFPGHEGLLRQPNSILALCYQRAILRLHAEMGLVTVPRRGDYHSADAAVPLPSATALRGAFSRGDWDSLRRGMPERAWHHFTLCVREGRFCREDSLDLPLLGRLRTMPEEAYASLPDSAEGLGSLLRKAARSALSREALIRQCTSARYPAARISRLCTHALLGISREDILRNPLPEALWPLGFNQTGAAVLSAARQRGVPVIAKATRCPQPDAPWFRVENQAQDLWALGAGLPMGTLFTRAVIRVE